MKNLRIILIAVGVLLGTVMWFFPSSVEAIETTDGKNCTLGNQSPALSGACGDCINMVPGRPNGWMVNFYNSTGTGHTRDECLTSQMASHMCNGGVSPEAKQGCLDIKNGACASACAGSTSPTPFPHNSDGTSSLVSATVEGPTSGAVGQELTYTVRGTTTANGGLGSVNVLWVRADADYHNNTPNPDCPAGKNGGIDNVNRQYCSFGSQGFTYNQSTGTSGVTNYALTATWTPKSPGVYYINPFVSTLSTEYDAYKRGIGSSPRIWCSGNPYCKWWGASSCPATGLGSSSSQCVSCGTISDFSCGGSNTGWKVVTIGGSGGGGSVSVTPSPSSSPTTSQSTKTNQYRYSLTRFEKNSPGPEWSSYSDADENGSLTISSFQLPDPAPGKIYTVFVQFKSDQGQASDVFSRSIKYIGPDPSLSNISCGYDPRDSGTLITINGNNFGAKGTSSVKVNNSLTATITSWSDVPDTNTDPTATPVASGSAEQSSETSTLAPTQEPSATPTVASTATPTLEPTVDESSPAAVEAASTSTITRSRVVARVNEKLDGSVAVELINADGRKITGTCDIGLTTVAMSAKLQCRPPENFATDKTRIQIYEEAEGARPIFDQLVNISADGRLSWTPPSLEVGKKYKMIAKAPKSLGTKKEFTALDGTTNLEEAELLVGDIAPLATPDNVVNSNDYRELIREWSASKDTTRAGDFNLDSRVNSIDYACLRLNFNKIGEPFLKGQ